MARMPFTLFTDFSWFGLELRVDGMAIGILFFSGRGIAVPFDLATGTSRADHLRWAS